MTSKVSMSDCIVIQRSIETGKPVLQIENVDDCSGVTDNIFVQNDPELVRIISEYLANKEKSINASS